MSSRAVFRVVLGPVVGRFLLIGSLLLGWSVASAGTGVDTGERLELPEVSRFEVTGIVVDEHDRPMMSVEVTIDERRFVPESGLMETTRRQEIVDGSFNIACDGCADLKLRFMAAGYRSEALVLSLTDEEVKTLLEAAPGEKPTLSRSGVVVRLQTPLPETPPIVIRGILDATSSGQMRVLAGTSPTGQQRLGPTSAYEGGKLRAKHGSSLSMVALEVPAESFSSLVEVARGGNVAISRAKDLEPIVVRFDLVGGGVIPAEPTGETIREQYRSLQEAPDKGYVDHLELRLGASGEHFFYCLVDGVYGKGRLAPVWEQSMAGEPALMTRVEIYLNPTGDPDLRGMVP